MNNDYIINSNGIRIHFPSAVELMDVEICAEVSNNFAPCSYQRFFDEYAQQHLEKYGEVWELDKANPVW